MRYHPLRVRQTRPFAPALASIVRENAAADGVLTIEAFEQGQTEIMGHFDEAIRTLPRLQRPQHPAKLISKELSRGLRYAHLKATGFNIFDLAPGLVDEFRKTRVGGVPAQALALPYSTLYLHFGAQRDLRLGEHQEPIEGAYINLSDAPNHKALEVTVTTRDAIGRDRWRDYLTHPEPDYYVSIDLDDESIDLMQLLEQAIEDERDAVRRGAPRPEDVEAAQPYAESHGWHLESIPQDVIDDREREILEGADAMREVMGLITNCLFYLTAYPDEASNEWPQGTPAKLARQVDRTKNRQKRNKAANELAGRGFTRVHFCRLSPSDDEPSADSTGEGRSRRAHWRRGHWRNQPFGKGRRQRRLQWIRPMLVNRGNEPASEGRIYGVD